MVTKLICVENVLLPGLILAKNHMVTKHFPMRCFEGHRLILAKNHMVTKQ